VCAEPPAPAGRFVPREHEKTVSHTHLTTPIRWALRCIDR
jgi:hypothetical protein